MSALKLIVAPDDRLSIKTEPVQFFNKELKDEVSEMAAIMQKEKGVGLAANQVGLNKSIFVIDVPYLESQDGKLCKSYIRRTMINPALELSGSDISIGEGCLSYPGKIINVPRKSSCQVTYQNLFGQFVVEEFSGIVAIVVQHEFDHLLGKTFIDYEPKS